MIIKINFIFNEVNHRYELINLLKPHLLAMMVAWYECVLECSHEAVYLLALMFF